jgi:hypothetical protein
MSYAKANVCIFSIGAIDSNELADSQADSAIIR